MFFSPPPSPPPQAPPPPPPIAPPAPAAPPAYTPKFKPGKYPPNGRDDDWTDEQFEALWDALTGNQADRGEVTVRKMTGLLNKDPELRAALGFRKDLKVTESGDDSNNRDYLSRLRDAAQKWNAKDQKWQDTESEYAKAYPRVITKGMLRALLQGGRKGQPSTYRNQMRDRVAAVGLAIVRLADWLDTFHID